MLNRSLSTFMNAMTGPDYTLYPYATQNRQDFYNLMSVYLDAVFKPLLTEKDFLQEGWRLDVDEKDPEKLMLKGRSVGFFFRFWAPDSDRFFGLTQANFEADLADFTQLTQNFGSKKKQEPCN